jgi:hypothetical protein
LFRIMTWKLYAVVSAGAFAATYLVSAPKTQMAHSADSSSAARSARQSAAETEIEALADSLHVRLRSEAVYQRPGRDPFQFQSRIQKPPASVPPPTVVESVSAPAPVLPVLRLTGIADDIADGMPRRSAVISMPAGVLIVREGEPLAGLYTVVAITEDSVELEATVDGSRRTLQLGR